VHNSGIIGEYCCLWKIVLYFTVGSRPSDDYFRSVCWFVCLFVCLFVYAEFFSAVWSDFDQTRTYVICLGL